MTPDAHAPLDDSDVQVRNTFRPSLAVRTHANYMYLIVYHYLTLFFFKVTLCAASKQGSIFFIQPLLRLPLFFFFFLEAREFESLFVDKIKLRG